MWRMDFLGTDLYYVILWFFLYSFLGWAVESAYMSFCSRRWTNRGFMFGPLCPIYGVGALTAYFMLRGISHNYILLYVVGCIVPTALEFLTAQIMLLIFGEVWWDYTEKPFNYRGILCLESTLVWGVYTVGLFAFLQKFVVWISLQIPVSWGMLGIKLVISAAAVDFAYHLIQAKTDALPHSFAELRESVRKI